jgi:pimeloyl-CoA synthetase
MLSRITTFHPPKKRKGIIVVFIKKTIELPEYIIAKRKLNKPGNGSAIA